MMARKSKLGRPPGRDSQKTRCSIVEAAVECFGRRGYALATNAEIAELAGVTAGAIYKHFDSKLDLFHAALRASKELCIPRFAEAGATPGSVREKVEAILRASAALFEEEPAITTFMSAIPIEVSRHPEIAESIQIEEREILEWFQKLLAGEDAAEAFAPGHVPIDVIHVFLASLMGLSQFSLASSDVEMGALIETYVALIEGAVFPEQG